MNNTNTEQSTANQQDEFYKLFDSEYSMRHLPFPNDFVRDQNLQLLYSKNNSNVTGKMYCEIDSQMAAISVKEFLLLADFRYYVSSAMGLVKVGKYYLHYPTGKVFELSFIDKTERCLAEQTDLSVRNVLADLKHHHYYTTYKASYRSYQVSTILGMTLAISYNVV